MDSHKTFLAPSFTSSFRYSPVAGFSVGDELGLAESLGNVEGSKRRALNIRTNVNNIGVLPASKMPVSTRKTTSK